MLDTIRHYFKNRKLFLPEKPAGEAYDLWAASYDCQPGNLMLDLDQHIFSELIKDIPLKNKRIADVGCGTGRHWQQLYSRQPHLLMGFDISAGMLQQLKTKFPYALVQQLTDNRLQMVSDESVDCLVSTLAVAHIKNIDEAIKAWTRIVKKGGWFIITDFHPAMLARGGKRSFIVNGNTVSVVNYTHSIKKLTAAFKHCGCSVVRQLERYVDESVKNYYIAKKALPVYSRFKGMPVIYGLQIRKDDDVAE